jgi:hypothetical protein
MKNGLYSWGPLLFMIILIIILIAVFIWKHSKNSELFSKIDDSESDKLIALGWAINKDSEKMKNLSKMFTDTAKRFNIEPRLLGLGHEFAKWDAPITTDNCYMAGKGLQRFHVLLDYLKNDGLLDDQIIIVMDTADTLFSGPKDEILKEYKDSGADILFSAEKYFTYQYPRYRETYDNNSGGSKYRYLAAGTFIGTVKAIREMIEECAKLGCSDKDSGLYGAVEMGVMSGWVAEVLNGSRSTWIIPKLDTKGCIFWVTTDDKKMFGDAVDNFEKNNKIYNSETKTEPQILHLLTNFGRERQEDAYNKIMGEFF